MAQTVTEVGPLAMAAFNWAADFGATWLTESTKALAAPFNLDGQAPAVPFPAVYGIALVVC